MNHKMTCIWTASLLLIICSSTTWAQPRLHDIDGKVVWPGTRRMQKPTPSILPYQRGTNQVSMMVAWDSGDEVSAAKIKLILSTNGEIVRYGWARGDGRFRISSVPAGSHQLEVSAIGMIYPQVSSTRHSSHTVQSCSSFYNKMDSERLRLP